MFNKCIDNGQVNLGTLILTLPTLYPPTIDNVTQLMEFLNTYQVQVKELLTNEKIKDFSGPANKLMVYAIGHNLPSLSQFLIEQNPYYCHPEAYTTQGLLGLTLNFMQDAVGNCNTSIAQQLLKGYQATDDGKLKEDALSEFQVSIASPITMVIASQKKAHEVRPMVEWLIKTSPTLTKKWLNVISIDKNGTIDKLFGYADCYTSQAKIKCLECINGDPGLKKKWLDAVIVYSPHFFVKNGPFEKFAQDISNNDKLKGTLDTLFLGSDLQTFYQYAANRIMNSTAPKKDKVVSTTDIEATDDNTVIPGGFAMNRLLKHLVAPSVSLIVGAVLVF